MRVVRPHRAVNKNIWITINSVTTASIWNIALRKRRTKQNENMGNKANNSKESILCDAKELMKLYDRVTWHLPKARREHSAVRRFEDAGYAIIHDCTIAMELKGEHEQQRKREYVEHLIGSFGEMLAAFDILMDMKDMTQKKSDADSKGEMYLFSDSAKLAIARLLERIETGAKKWRNSIR